MTQLTGRGQGKYWFQGKPFPGADHANESGSQKYWFNGMPMPYVYAEAGTVYPVTLDDTLGLSDSPPSCSLEILRLIGLLFSDGNVKSIIKSEISGIDVGDSIEFQAERSAMLADLLSLVDLDSKSIEKSYLSGLMLADTLTVQLAGVVSKTLIDHLAMSDALGKNLATVLLDETALGDSFSKESQKRISQILGLSDEHSLATSRTLVFSLLMDDNISKETQKQLSDNLIYGDVFTKENSKQFVDSLLLEEHITKSLTKAILDALNLTDSVTAQKITSGIVEHAITLADTLLLSDVYSKVKDMTITDALQYITDTCTPTITRLVFAVLFMATDIKDFAGESTDIKDLTSKSTDIKDFAGESTDIKGH